MAEEKTNECCSSSPRLIFACSGATDVGEIADRAARKITKDGIGKMFCLAGISGRTSGIMETTRAASEVLAIDGCSLACVKKTLEREGFGNFKHLQLADIGLEKGSTPVTEENIAKVAAEGTEMIGQ